MSELKKTVYLPSALIMGSREQYCHNQQIKHLKSAELNAKCASCTKEVRHDEEE